MSSKPSSKSSKSSKSATKRYSMKDVPRSQIDFIVGRLHVGTPDEEVAADIRKRAEASKWPKPVVTLAVKYAVERHQSNRGVYSDVMSGNLGRKRRMSREDGHASGHAHEDRLAAAERGSDRSLKKGDRVEVYMPWAANGPGLAPSYRWFGDLTFHRYDGKHAMVVQDKGVFAGVESRHDPMNVRRAVGRSKSGHASGEALTDRFSRMPGTYELYFFVVKAALMERYGFSAEQADTMLARPRTKTWVRASYRASHSPALMAADLSKADGDWHRSRASAVAPRRGHSIGRQKLTYTPDPYPHAHAPDTIRDAPDTIRDMPDTERGVPPTRPTRQKLTYTPDPRPQHAPPHRQKLVYTPPGYSRGSTDDGLYVVQALHGGRVVMSDSFDKRKDADACAREWLAFRGAEYTSVRIITRDGDLVSNHRVGDPRRKSR